MTEILTHPTYRDIDQGINSLCRQIIVDPELLPTTIVGLVRGGLIPAVVISHAFGTDNKHQIVSIAFSSKTGNGDGKNHNNILPELPTNNVLIVDDIADGGHTLDEICSHYKKYDPDIHIRTAVLYYKESSVHMPTYYWQKIPGDSPWIIFPWENGTIA